MPMRWRVWLSWTCSGTSSSPPAPPDSSHFPRRVPTWSCKGRIESKKKQNPEYCWSCCIILFRTLHITLLRALPHHSIESTGTSLYLEHCHVTVFRALPCHSIESTAMSLYLEHYISLYLEHCHVTPFRALSHHSIESTAMSLYLEHCHITLFRALPHHII